MWPQHHIFGLRTIELRILYLRLRSYLRFYGQPAAKVKQQRRGYKRHLHEAGLRKRDGRKNIHVTPLRPLSVVGL